ncbi:MAG: Ig-like domain-containing protein [Gemmatimonadota bacterium]|nr:Ig-like domain-containing protein [Gemmatimonadota bacterium]
MTLFVNDSSHLTGQCTDRYGAQVAPNAITWTVRKPSIASVSSRGLVTAKTVGATAILVASGGVTDSAIITVKKKGGQPPTKNPWNGPPQGSPPVTNGYPNQPSGMKFITERSFNTKSSGGGDYVGAEGWDPVESRFVRFTVVRDATAPKSASTVGQFIYPQGFRGGASPATAQLQFTIPVRTLYLSMWVKLSSNFEGHSSSTNKMFFLWISRGQRFFLSAEGAGLGHLYPQVRLQGVPDPRGRLRGNLAHATVARGHWQRWELIVKANTPGSADGEVHWWIDGTKITDYRDLEIVSRNESPEWDQFQWSATWGGGGNTVAQDMFLWYDHIYISGR